MHRRVIFDGKPAAVRALAPQVAITLVFFLLAGQPRPSTTPFSCKDAFGLRRTFVGFEGTTGIVLADFRSTWARRGRTARCSAPAVTG